ncbi:unnamed protein product [Brassicogethes aeneus]|uniref:G patch domain-containing protein 4 n=1 Tax=Brassicogethes aeneus TaxID=1431903 RepID=A0A9P0FFA0_BRAAE|nr:unnamed protein product [Brassicogethes aeneus]
MDFAKKQLEKYGWTDGKGLGKNEDGINSALKPKLKFDNTGLGHDRGKEFTNKWWENVYNAASSNFDVHKENDKVSVKEKKRANIDQYLPLGKSTNYKNLESSFLKTAKLTETGMETYDVQPVESLPKPKAFELTDDQLFKACGGRTAHKGARHGLTLSGKLSRIEKQEEMLLRKLKKVSLTDEGEITKKKLTKLKKKKEETLTKEPTEVEMEATTSKKKHKKRKSVTFNENITKIYTIEPETSFDSEVSSHRDENSNEPNVEMSNGSDEGIEQDVENNNNDQNDDHRSFELAQFNYNDLSKAERKKLKKKRKLEAKTETSTSLFIEEALTNEEEKESAHKKRKCEFEDKDKGLKRSQSVTDFPERTKNKKNKKKRKKERESCETKEKKAFRSLTKSMTKACRISDDE